MLKRQQDAPRAGSRQARGTSRIRDRHPAIALPERTQDFDAAGERPDESIVGPGNAIASRQIRAMSDFDAQRVHHYAR